MRRIRWKRKDAFVQTCSKRKFGECGSQLFCPKTYQSLRSTGGVRSLSSLVRRADSHMKPRGANRTPSASLSAAAPPSNSGRGFQRRGPHLRPPSPGEGFQRERAAALALRVVGGPGRSRNALVLFFRGVGRVLFQKRMRPTSLRWEPPLAGVREMWGTFQWAKPIEKNCTAICSISASAHTAAPLPQWASAYPAGSGGWRPAPRPHSWRPARPDRSLSGRPRTVRRFRPPAPSE